MKRLTSLTARTIQRMRNNSGFNFINQALSEKGAGINGLNVPTLSRKLCQPSFSILQFESDHEETSHRAGPYYPSAIE